MKREKATIIKYDFQFKGKYCAIAVVEEGAKTLGIIDVDTSIRLDKIWSRGGVKSMSISFERKMETDGWFDSIKKIRVLKVV